MAYDPALFAKDVKAWADATEAQMMELARVAASRVAKQIAQDTPFDNGFARASWWAALNDPTGSSGPAPGSSDGGASAPLVWASAKPGDTFYFWNNCVYINRLEFDGHSAQAPNGFVRVNVAKWDAVVEQVAKEMGLA